MSEDAFHGKRKRSDEDELGYPPSLGIQGSSGKWSEELHRFFVAAIYDAGVSQSSPSVLLENMTDPPVVLTSERVKSHLQKYRKNKQKSKEDFMKDYDSFMRKAMTVGGAGANANHVVMPPSAMIEMMGGGKPSGGETAAFLSYSIMTEGELQNAPGPPISSGGITKESQDYLKIFAGTHVPFPQLTEDEKRSPLGVSMVYVMGLFSSLSQHMLQERRKRARPGAPQSTNAVASVNYAHTMHTTSTAESGNLAVGTVANSHHHRQQQDDASNSNNGMPWLTAAAAAKQPPFLAPHYVNNQHQAVSGDVSSSNNHSDMPQPGQPSGLFYPVVSRGDLDEPKEAIAHWRVAVQQESGEVPGMEGAPANASRAPNRDSNSAHGGSGPYAQV